MNGRESHRDMAVWYESKNRGGFRAGQRLSIDAPFVTMMAAGAGGDSYGHWHLYTDGVPMADSVMLDKPPYRVPAMAEIAAIPKTGLTVVSTFSGCGGSCLGFELAGYTILWANEFIPAARDVYEANHPGVPVDPRSIRDIAGADILRAIGRDRGDIDVLEGSPPCASFSTAGNRERDWGKVKKYSDSTERTDDLFFEFVRILGDLQPRTFVAENVSGLVKGTAKGYFKRILRAMRETGYRVEARLLDAQWLGVPQARQRIIFVGVRNDVGRDPAFPSPLPYRYSVRDALPWIVAQGDNAGFGGGTMREAVIPSPTIGASPQTGNGRFPPSLVDATPYLEADRRTSGFSGAIERHSFDAPLPTVTANGIGADWRGDWLIVSAETDISRYAIGAEWDKLAPGESTYYGGRLWRPDPERPCPTVTQTGGNLGASSVTHPTERRKFTIAELKRLCAFPDDFILTGTYAQQWERLGRAVPPLMMRAVAETLRDRVLMETHDAG